MIRAFIAIDLPKSVQEAIGLMQQRLRASGAAVTWVRPERMHLTLKFLGGISPAQEVSVRERLNDITGGVSSFQLEPVGCGAFPSIKQMRVIWVGLHGGEEPLKQLQQRLEAAMEELAFKREERAFKPHLTLGRVKGKQRLRVLEQLLLEEQSFRTEAFDVSQLVLYKSDLKPEGAVYTPLFKAKFRPE
jgi:RNA 2',3'-cyclic 3'-phosphodiesterase